MNFNIDDKVVYSYRGKESIEKVERITPTGRVIVCGKQFINGRNHSDKWYTASIYHATEEDIERIRINVIKNNIIYKLYRFNWNGISYKQAIEIRDILGFKEKE